MKLSERERPKCLAVRLGGPSVAPILCGQPEGHDGPHQNSRFKWTCYEDVTEVGGEEGGYDENG